MSKISNIQALRFLAAFFVILVHLPFFGFGAWGVDIFFIISGFIICHITQYSSKNFLIKRIIRIVPTYWFFTIGVFIISFFLPNLLNNTTFNYEHLIKSLFFIPFDKNGTGHFPILFLGWSLNYEMLFYLIFFIAMKINYKYRSLICSSFIILIFIISNKLSYNNFIFKVYSESIFLEFVLGILIYNFYKNFNYIKKKFNFLFNNSSLIIFIIGYIFIYFNHPNLPRVFTYGFPSFLLMYFVLFKLKKNFFNKKLVVLGDSSYIIYLIHPYIIQFFLKIINYEINSIFLNIISSIILIIIVLFSSKLIHIYFEKKIIYILKKNLL